MFQILTISSIILIIFLAVFITRKNQVKNMGFTELNYLREFRKRSDRNYLKPSFEKWKHDKFKYLWFLYAKTDMSESFNDFCLGLFYDKIEIIIEQ